MKYRMFSGIGVFALLLALAVAGVDAFAQHDQTAHMKLDSNVQACAEACSDCQRVCDLCATHCANLLADGRKEHLSCLMHCRGLCDVLCRLFPSLCERRTARRGDGGLLCDVLRSLC